MNMDNLDLYHCPKCNLARIPDVRIVRKNGKRWKIIECRICRMKDLEPAPKPSKVFRGGHFVDDTEWDEVQD